MTLAGSENTHTDDFLLLVGFAMCVGGFWQGYWYWTFVGTLLFLSGLGAFRKTETGAI